MSDKTITAEDIQEYEERRAQECMTHIQNALKDYGMELVGVPALTPDGRIRCDIQLRKAVQ